MAKVNIAVIGCGLWGPNHVRNFIRLPDAHVVSVVDFNDARLSSLKKMFPDVQLTNDYKQVLEDPDLDAIVVATPTNTHFEIVRDALLYDKHVLCEKPLCKTDDEAQQLVKIAVERQLVLMVGHVFLFNPGLIKVKEILDTGEAGDMHYISAIRTNLGPIRSDVNAAFDLASHDISIFNWILDAEPEFVSAIGAPYLQPDLEDVVFISLKYPGNVLANIQASWLNPRKVRQISFIGTKKMITWDDMDQVSPVAIYDKGANARQSYSDFGEFLRISTWEGDVRLPRVYFDEPLKLQNSHFIAAIENGRGVERSDARFASGVVKVLESAVESVRSNGKPIAVRS